MFSLDALEVWEENVEKVSPSPQSSTSQYQGLTSFLLSSSSAIVLRSRADLHPLPPLLFLLSLPRRFPTSSTSNSLQTGQHHLSLPERTLHRPQSSGRDVRVHPRWVRRDGESTSSSEGEKRVVEGYPESVDGCDEHGGDSC